MFASVQALNSTMITGRLASFVCRKSPGKSVSVFIDAATAGGFGKTIFSSICQ